MPLGDYGITAAPPPFGGWDPGSRLPGYDEPLPGGPSGPGAGGGSVPRGYYPLYPFSLQGPQSQRFTFSPRRRLQAVPEGIGPGSMLQMSDEDSGYYGTGYWWAGTKAISDGATFWFYLPAAASKSIDAWWTAGGNRSPQAPFVAFNAGGTKLGTSTVDQRSNGSKWVTLGTWSFSAGWNKVVLSRWAPEGYVVVADAIRVR